MERIASFTVDHLNLMPGLYVSRRDKRGDVVITTFDMRMTAPNREPVMDVPALHTIEHLGATYLRNSKYKEDIVYFGPMGCRTGCYILMFGDLTSEDIVDMVLDMCDFIISFEGDIPGASAVECGNFSEQNLEMAKFYAKMYKERLLTSKSFVYPD
jgi:S-ribosylhomocysteine lyase